MSARSDKHPSHSSNRTPQSRIDIYHCRNIHRYLSFLSPFRGFAALPVVCEAIQQAARDIIQRFGSTASRELVDHFQHAIQVSDSLFDFIDLPAAGLREQGASFLRAECKIEEVFGVFESESKFLNSLDESDRAYVIDRVLSITRGRCGRFEEPLSLIEADGFDANACRLRQGSDRHMFALRAFHVSEYTLRT